MKSKASDEQQKIITYNAANGALLVNAAAGSGKTFVLTERVRYLLTEKKGKFKVLCLTFTNKAAEEMKVRLGDVENITERAFIGTLHSFALEVLIARRNDIGYDDIPHIIERESDRMQILKDILLENIEFREYITNQDEKQLTELLSSGLNLISESKKQLLFPDDERLFQKWDSDTILLYKEYNEKLKSQNLIDFDDILLLAWSIFINNPSAASLYRKIYKYILVDEAQDLSFAQYEMIKAICGNELRNVFMVGDPNQAIHGYAGASKEFMQKHFVKDYNAEVLNLKYNYRSSEAIIRIAEAIAPKSNSNSNAFYKGNCEILNFENEELEAEWIIKMIKELIKSGKYEGEIFSIDDIAVLARNKYVFNVLINKLDNDEQLKNNYHIKKGSDSLLPESVIMKKFDLGTRLLSNPRDNVHLNQLVELFNKEKQSIRSTDNSNFTDGIILLQSLLKGNKKDDTKILLDAWKILNVNINKFSESLSIIRDYAIKQKDENAAIIMNDIEAWAETWKKYIKNSTSRSIADFRRFAAMGGTSLNKYKGFTLSVVHMVKGLEYHTVFLMGMNDGTFPDYRAVKQGEKAILEEQNTAYVAVTRAKRQLFITYPLQKKMPWGDIKNQIPSRFIKQMI